MIRIMTGGRPGQVLSLSLSLEMGTLVQHPGSSMSCFWFIQTANHPGARRSALAGQESRVCLEGQIDVASPNFFLLGRADSEAKKPWPRIPGTGDPIEGLP